jgi:hypothetical protein
MLATSIGVIARRLRDKPVLAAMGSLFFTDIRADSASKCSR